MFGKKKEVKEKDKVNMLFAKFEKAKEDYIAASNEFYAAYEQYNKREQIANALLSPSKKEIPPPSWVSKSIAESQTEEQALDTQADLKCTHELKSHNLKDAKDKTRCTWCNKSVAEIKKEESEVMLKL